MSLSSYPELRKLQQLKDDQGELSASDEKRFRTLKKQCERELLQVCLFVCLFVSECGCDLLYHCFRMWI